MGRTKSELETENRDLREIVGEIYDRVADYIEPSESESTEPDDDGEDEAEEEDDDEDG